MGCPVRHLVFMLVVPAARRDVLEAHQIRLSHEAWTDFLDILDRPNSAELAGLRGHAPTWGEPRS